MTSSFNKGDIVNTNYGMGKIIQAGRGKGYLANYYLVKIDDLTRLSDRLYNLHRDSGGLWIVASGLVMICEGD